MLVLTRNATNSEVRLTDRVSGRLLGVVKLVEVGTCGRVRIGFEFDQDVTICRGEIAAKYEQFETQTEEAVPND